MSKLTYWACHVWNAHKSLCFYGNDSALISQLKSHFSNWYHVSQFFLKPMEELNISCLATEKYNAFPWREGGAFTQISVMCNNVVSTGEKLFLWTTLLRFLLKYNKNKEQTLSVYKCTCICNSLAGPCLSEVWPYEANGACILRGGRI